MKIEVLFSRNKKCGSKLISWASSFEDTGLKDIPSHGAILVNDKMVVESTFFSGVRMVPYESWSKINEELFRIPIQTGIYSVSEVYSLVASFWGKGYDFKGILYFVYCFLKLIILKRDLPKENKWQRSNKYFCTEVVGKFMKKDLSMYTPAKICQELLQNNI